MNLSARRRQRNCGKLSTRNLKRQAIQSFLCQQLRVFIKQNARVMREREEELRNAIAQLLRDRQTLASDQKRANDELQTRRSVWQDKVRACSQFEVDGNIAVMLSQEVETVKREQELAQREARIKTILAEHVARANQVEQQIKASVCLQLVGN